MTQILPAAVERRDDGRTVFTRTVEVTTPVFGGGVHLPDSSEKPIDPITPIRGAGLRGQLRFWWRAMYGCQFALVEMKAIEARIWGRDAVQEQRIGPSKVALRVGTQPRTARCNILGDDRYTASLPSPLRDALGYAAFPLRSEKKGEPDGWVTRLLGKTRITLSVDADGLSPAEVASVEAAFDAWLSFGGVGGRTRRGFGAVSGPHSLAVDLLGRACSPRAGSQIPNLGAARTALSRASFNTALEAWAHGLDRLKTMRQGLGVGRHRKAGEVGWKAAGRSNWPEPDEIRRLTRQTASSHREPVTAVRAMPRAAFGMPIIFHFKTYGDPTDTTLKPRGADRLASPLIIRPTLMADGRYKTLALVLGGSCAHDLAVELSGNRQSHVVRTRLTAADASRGRPARPLQGEPDPLQAFLNFIAKDPSA